MAKRTIRQLQRGEEPPATTPRRYRNASGYVRLRWKIAPYSYVECYEHRFVMGLPPDDVHVHHINHIRDDNRPENLRVIDPGAHSRHHHASPLGPEIAAMYAGGMNMPQIAAETGLDPGAISRIVRRHGVKTRSTNHDRIPVDTEVIRHLYERGVGMARIAELLGVSTTVVSARLKAMGVPARREGRPTDAQREEAQRAIDVITTENPAWAEANGWALPSWGAA